MNQTPTARIALADTKPAAMVTDALVVALSPGRGKKAEVIAPGLTAAVRTKLAEAFTAVGATGKAGEVTRIPGGGGLKAPIVVGVGLGDAAKQADAESVRRAVGEAVRSLAGTRRIALALPLADDDALLTVSIAALMSAYDYVSFRNASKKDRKAPVHSITVLLPAAPTPEQKQAVKEVSAVASAVNLTRDLVNTPPNALTPSVLAASAVLAVDGLPIDVTIWDELDLVRDGCGGILAVGQGSANAPRLTRLQYAPEGATRHLALVGKGITFDTGGISIKPAANMDEMKSDMAGAAAVIGAVKAIAELALPIRVTGWVPSAENMPSGTAQRPGDVITIYGGKTVEVLNTDAEGRLILADALGMAAAGQARPDHRHRDPHRRGRGRPRGPHRRGHGQRRRRAHRRLRRGCGRAARRCGRCRCPTTCGPASTRAPPTSPTSATGWAGCSRPASSCGSSSLPARPGCTSTSPVRRSTTRAPTGTRPRAEPAAACGCSSRSPRRWPRARSEPVVGGR